MDLTSSYNCPILHKLNQDQFALQCNVSSDLYYSLDIFSHQIHLKICENAASSWNTNNGLFFSSKRPLP